MNDTATMTQPVQAPQEGVLTLPPQPKKSEVSPSAVAAIEMWSKRIKKAKGRWKADYARMRDNMKFAAGLQWPGQTKLDDQRYQANITLRAINQKVATLYARNPTAEYQRRPRLDFALYDGHLESIIPAVQAATMHPMGLGVLPPQQMALLADYQHGIQMRQLIDKVGKTLEIVFQYQLDEQDKEEGEFKLQMKQTVRRTITTAVGYCRISFVRDTDTQVTSTGPGETLSNYARRAVAIAAKLKEGAIDENDPRVEQMEALLVSLGVATQEAQGDLQERLVFDCLPSTSVIPDIHCRCLKGFVGARWLAQEFMMSTDDVNAIFGTDIKTDSKVKLYSATGEEKVGSVQDPRFKEELNCCLWEVLDKTTKSHFFIVDGYKDYVMPPTPLKPSVRGFWPIAALTFNDIEVEEGQAITLFPPSDVQLMKHPQMEWNRSRNELKKHRKANAPGYLASKGMLTDEDIEALEGAPSNSVTQLQGVPTGTPLDKAIVPRQNVQIQPQMYDTMPQSQDIALTIGTSQENLGQAQKGTTATGDTIAEQSRLTVTSSNIDDLDDFLSTLTRIGGEMLMKEMSPQTVQRIAGPGAVWLQGQPQWNDFLDQIFLMSKAASSGRPNKALEMRNWQIAAPVLQAAGANPQFLVRETLRRLDDQLDPEQAFPLMPQQPGAMQTPQGGEHQPSPQEQHQPGANVPPQQGRPGPGVQQPQPQK